MVVESSALPCGETVPLAGAGVGLGGPSVNPVQVDKAESHPLADIQVKHSSLEELLAQIAPQ